jgi:hypothetical protein
MLKVNNVSLHPAVAAVCLLSFCASPALRAQQDEETIREVKVTNVDLAAAHLAAPGRVHALPANVAGATEKLTAFHRERNAVARKSDSDSHGDSASANAPYFYPGDLSSGGGPTLASTRQHAVYVNANGSIASNWGNPEGFLRDLNESSFIQITNQYVGTRAEDRYPVGEHARVHYGTPGATLYEQDIAAIAHAVAKEHGAGGGNIYHVFLPQGTDTCFDVTPQNPVPVCYSPDNPATFAFCGYHDAVPFQDIGIVLFTVEPWQGPGSGCEIATPPPNSLLIDSTNNVLSHETFETITDPLPGLGYFNQTGGLLTGAEIGDECVLFNFSNSPGAYAPPTFEINGKNYAVQPEYSNKYHACVTQP